MSDGRCDTCKFWKSMGGIRISDSDPRYESVEFGRQLIPQYKGWKRCTLVNQKTRVSERKAELLGSLPEYVHLYTAPDFGCVQWEAKA